MKRVFIAGVLSLALTGCGDDGDGEDGPVNIATGTLTGKVGGMSWTLASARTNAFLSDDASFWVDMYSATGASCSGGVSGDSLIVAVPKQVGTHRLNLDLNGTFVVGEGQPENYIATDGAIRVDEVTSTTVRGGLSMTYDASNSVSGTFEATVCP